MLAYKSRVERFFGMLALEAGRAATSWSSSSVDVPVTMQGQVPTVPLLMTCTHSAHCAENRRNSPRPVLGAGS